MAKRYVRLNWQNKPSVATPISAINLNIMDKGIDDLDLFKVDSDAIVNNGVTTVAGTVLDGRMGKTLQDQTDTINNNLERNIIPSVDARGFDILTKAYDTLGSFGFCYLIISPETTGLPEETSTWHKATGLIMVQWYHVRITLYSTTAIAVNYYDGDSGVWSGWKKTALT